MNKPIFGEYHANAVHAALRENPDCAVVLVYVPAQQMLIAGYRLGAGKVRFTIEVPVGPNEPDERKAQLEASQLVVEDFDMRTDSVVPLDLRKKH